MCHVSKRGRYEWVPLFGRRRLGATVWALLFGRRVFWVRIFWAPSFGRTRSGAFIWAHPFRRYCLGAEFFGRTRFYCLGAEIFGRGCFGSHHLGASIWALCFGRRDFWARVSWAHAFGRTRLGEIVSALSFLGAQKTK